ncbi:hypothetical protein KFL_001900240 [Klebsormidium nitens]|uniref:BACK domain-containing protein n=1 Tax=Klebsormidium nitens TaxID=105231 RepID=A0A1Y1I5P4_KLENI|nr:hypothetical protein KFL_001900240 [Klebsormidium nitens]|eukprot:GAQ84481.1 hypothetical protein KFL_001900240 [Klebsormidium nitens]
METVELLLQSDKFPTVSEELVVDAILGWVRANVDEMDGRREAMTRLSTHIEFKCLSWKYLEMVRDAPEMQSQSIQGTVHDLMELRSYVDGHERDWPADAPCFGIVKRSHLEMIGTFRPGRNCTAASKTRALAWNPWVIIRINCGGMGQHTLTYMGAVLESLL